MTPTTNAKRTKGFLSSIGVEYSMLFMLAGLTLAVFMMLSLLGNSAPKVDAKVVIERVLAVPEPELDFAPPSVPAAPAEDRTATVVEGPQ